MKFLFVRAQKFRITPYSSGVFSRNAAWVRRNNRYW
jgi:hypothetical protein